MADTPESLFAERFETPDKAHRLALATFIKYLAAFAGADKSDLTQEITTCLAFYEDAITNNNRAALLKALNTITIAHNEMSFGKWAVLDIRDSLVRSLHGFLYETARLWKKNNKLSCSATLSSEINGPIMSEMVADSEYAEAYQFLVTSYMLSWLESNP